MKLFIYVIYSNLTIDANVEVVQDDDEPADAPHWQPPHNVEYDPDIDDFPPHEPVMQPYEEELEREMKEQNSRGKVRFALSVYSISCQSTKYWFSRIFI